MHHVPTCTRPTTARRLTSLAALALLCNAAMAANWPCYRHDSSRSGVTDDALTLPLNQQWHYTTSGAPKPAWAPPKAVPVEGYLEMPRDQFDDAYHVAIADGLAYFCSSAENKVYALDAATGETVWSFYTDAPPRLAPAIENGRVYFGADDGFVYCLNAADGSPVWKFRAAPSDRRVLGNGRMISLWPVRTGVLVEDGVVYFGAGVFPAERVYLYAVNAADGTLLAKNDTMSDQGAGQNAFVPQGYLLASATKLYVPTGRTMPWSFDRKKLTSTGRPNVSKATGMVGGTYALLDGDRLYTGTQEITSVDNNRAGQFAWFRGKRLVVAGGMSFLLHDKGISALLLDKYSELSRKRKGAQIRRAGLAGQAAREKDEEKAKTLKEQIADLDRELEQLGTSIDDARPWRLEHEGLAALILAGDVLVAGGNGEVVAVDAATGELLWTGAVEGTAKGLAASDGRLLVSTDKGAVYCFAAPEGTGADTAPKGNTFPDDDLTRLCATAAEKIVNDTGITRGYCLVWGSGTGRLAAEIAKRTELTVYGVERDAGKVKASRDALSAAGLYGNRVTIQQDRLASIAYSEVPLSDYFANLVVSETALVEGKLPGPASEVFRMLKPCGGTVYLGQPAGADGAAAKLAADAAATWLAGADLQGAEPTAAGGWTKLVRGRLPGSADWSHQYAEPGNTASSEDRVVKCPLGVLWFGEPGPDKAISRHQGAPTPLVVNGRCFREGELDDRAGKPLVTAFDAYNGLILWERRIPGGTRTGMIRDASRLAATDDYLFVGTGDKCLRLDAETGETSKGYELPAEAKAANHQWGFIALSDGLLYGSVTPRSVNANAVFALDIETGDTRWVYKAKSVKQNTICLSGGRVYFADRNVTAAQREEALQTKVDELVARKSLTRAEATEELKSADVRLVVALDAKTGDVAWQKPVDLTDCGGDSGVLSAMCHRGVLVFCGSHGDGHYWPQFLGGEYAARKVVALSAADGAPLWQKAIGYRIRPLILGDTLYAEPWAFDLATGEQRMRTHPITGKKTVWQFERPGHHCGIVCGSPNALFFRSYSIAYYDLLADQGTNHFAGQRTGCWINIVPADGLVVVPEGSSGCVCPFPLHTTVVLQHRPENRAWGIYSSDAHPDQETLLPVRNLNINLGAPGDRRGPDGKLWLSYPRPGGRMRVKFDVGVQNLPGQGFFSSPAEYAEVAGTNTPWLYASGSAGLRKLTLPLVGEADGAALYTVRLGFADRDNDQPGQRVFDIKLQGQVAVEGFDIAQAAGGKNAAVVKEFAGVQIDGDLTVELVPKEQKPAANQVPLLNTIEVARERTLQVGMAAPTFLLSDLQKRQAGTVTIANNTDKEFVGKLRVTVPEGFTATPAEEAIRLAPDERTTVDLTLAVAKSGQAAEHKLALALVWEDGKEETLREPTLEYLGPRSRKVIVASEDAYVSAGQPTKNFGTSATFLVDGGAGEFGDHSHNIAYLKFPLDIPGKAVSVKLRVRTSPSEASESGNSGDIRLVEDPWEEYKLTFATRPKPGEVLAKLGKVGRDVWEERELKVDLTGRKELSVVIEPTTTDGANYYSREGGNAAQLVVEYEAE